MKTAIYVRQSLDKTGEELGVTRQLEECQALAERRGYEVIEVVRENNRSATRGDRPGYKHLRELIESGTVQGVVVWRIDRLLRKLTELEELIDLCERTGAQVATVSGDFDLTNSTGRLLGRILASVARSEVEVKSERHRLANEQKARAGKPHASRRPYGYTKNYASIYEPEATVLREMAARVMTGESYKEVAYWLNSAGHLTSEGHPWYPVTVRNMLTKDRYAGVRLYKGTPYPAQWSPIFDAETWERLQLTLRLRREANGDRPLGRKYLLTGLVYCGKCGRPLNGASKVDHPGRPKRRTYHCRVQGDKQRAGGCGGIVRNADALEDFLFDAVAYRLDSPALASLLGAKDDGRLSALLAERKASSDRLDALVDDYADGTLDKRGLDRASSRLRTRLLELEDEIERSRLSGLNMPLKAGETFKEAWATHGDGWKFEVLSLLIERVVLHPSNRKPYYKDTRWRFDPEAVEVCWRA